MLARAGLYLPRVTCSQELAEGRDPIEIGVNYANIAQAASALELRSPIAFDLTTSTVTSKPTIDIDRRAPASQITLPLPVTYTSATAKRQRRLDATFWLSALAASKAAQKSPHRPFDLEEPLSTRQLRNAKLFSMASLLEMMPGSLLLAPELGLALSITAMAAGAAGTMLGFLRAQSIVTSEQTLDSRSDASAARYLKNPLLALQAGRLASKYPVLEPQV